jgi:Flp pilus assembly protein TadD
VRLAERAVALTLRRDASTLDVLAIACAASGDFDRAVSITGEALALNPSAPVSATIRAHQELFLARQPYVAGR